MLIVTGGAGFIGSNLVHALNRAGRSDIIVVDDCKDADAFRNLNRCEFLDLVASDDFISRLDDFADCEGVFHQGAISATTEKDGRALLRNNIDTSKRLLAWTQAKAIPFLFASSASVYGNGDDGFHDDTPGCEYPLNGYAFSKWLFDRHVRRLAGTFRSQVVGLRYFNVYGRQEWHKGGMCSPVLHFHRQIAAEGRLKLFAGSDGFRRDFVTVEDCCAVNLWFWTHPQISGIFNCGTGQVASFAEVAHLVAAEHPTARIEEVPFPDHLKGKYQAYTCADLTRLRAAGYDAPFTPVSVGVPAYARSLKGPAGGYL
jgi:ADP-L-glycero-D-manno-heptose 6-epimerase